MPTPRLFRALWVVGVLGAPWAAAGDPASVPSSQLYANQQLFHWICTRTIANGAAADADSCDWKVFRFPGSGNDVPAETELGSPIPLVPLEPGAGLGFPGTTAGTLEQAWPGRVLPWTTVGTRRQPGTAQMVDGAGVFEKSREFGPHCVEPDGAGGLQPLPGCRGIETVFVARDPVSLEVTSVQIAFEDGYRPLADGCLVGGAVAADAPLEVIGRLGADIETGEGGVAVVLVANAHGTFPDPAEMRLCHEASSPPGSGWLWHPLAGCLDEARAAKVSNFGTGNPGLEREADTDSTFGDCGIVLVDGTPTERTFLDRFTDYNQDGILDIEQEFLGSLGRADCAEAVEGVCEVVVGTAQLFQNRLAAISWNHLQKLVATSCSELPAAERLDDLSCFDPDQALRADRCSFNAPRLCRAVIATGLVPVPVAIDVQPRRQQGRRSWRKVAVQVFGSERVDVREIDVASLAFGPGGTAPWKKRRRYRDRDRDGHLDLITWYRVPASDLEADLLCLEGGVAGASFQGCQAPKAPSLRSPLSWRSVFGGGD